MLILILLIVVLVLLVWVFVCVGNKAFKLKEQINVNKSNLRIVKSKYLSVLSLSSRVHFQNANIGNDYYMPNNNMVTFGNGSPTYVEGNRLIEEAAAEYLKIQETLNYSIKHYNEYVLTFPRIIITRILGHKREKFIEDDNLNKDILINSNIDNIEL